MGTVVALESADGVVIAADSKVTAEGTVTNERVDRIVDMDSAGAGAVGPVAGIQEFHRQLAANYREE
jgi:20S proteasome alpha/beta subunit